MKSLLLFYKNRRKKNSCILLAFTDKIREIDSEFSLIMQQEIDSGRYLSSLPTLNWALNFSC